MSSVVIKCSQFDQSNIPIGRKFLQNGHGYLGIPSLLINNGNDIMSKIKKEGNNKNMESSKLKKDEKINMLRQKSIKKITSFFIGYTISCKF